MHESVVDCAIVVKWLPGLCHAPACLHMQLRECFRLPAMRCTNLGAETNLVLQGALLSLLGIKLRPEAVSALLRHIEV